MIISKIIIAFLLIVSIHVKAQLSRTYDNGAALFSQGDYAGAKIMMNRVINQSAYYFEAYTIRGRAYEQLGMPDSALIDFNKALEIKPDFLPAIFFRGVLLYNQKDYQKAKSDFDKILGVKPDYINALIHRGRTNEAIGNIDEAINDYTLAINLKLKNYEVYFRRGLLYENDHKPKLALWDFNKSVETNPKFVQGYLHRGKMNLLLSKDEDALADFDKVISMTDTIPEVFKDRGDLYFKAKNYKAAADDYSVLIEKFRQKDATLYFQRADSYFLDSNFSMAYKEYSRVLVVKPRYDKAIVGQAKVRIIEGKPTSAIPLLRKAIAFNITNGEAHYLMGKILFDQKKYAEALKEFNLAINYQPIPAAYFFRGSCKFENGDKYGACLDLQESVKLGYKEDGIDDMVKRVCR